MSTSILVGYATRYGSTQQVAEAIADTLRAAGLPVELKLSILQPFPDARLNLVAHLAKDS